MTMSKWLPLSLFVAAVIVAWHLAQPPKQLAAPQSIVPANPMNDAVDSRQLIPNRLIVTPAEPMKFSDGVRVR